MVPNVYTGTIPDGGYGDTLIKDLDQVLRAPSSVPDPVVSSYESNNPDQSPEPSGQPNTSTGVTAWIENFWQDLTAPLMAIWDGIDIFWPFRFMDEEG